MDNRSPLAHEDGPIFCGPLDTLMAYAEAVDARDPARIGATLSQNVKLTRGLERFEGRGAFIGAYAAFLTADLLGSRHVVTNHRFSVQSEGLVLITSCFEATFFEIEKTRKVIGRYEDDFIREDERWVIAHKRNHIDWAYEMPAATHP